MTELTEHIDVEHMLESLEISNMREASGGSEMAFSCPFHQDERPSCYMNKSTTAWLCWSCKERGRTAISFTAKVLGVSYAQAKTFLLEAYGVDFDEPEGGSMAAETEARFAPPAEPMRLRPPQPTWQSLFVETLWDHDEGRFARDYFRQRGFTDEIMLKWDVGFDLESGRLAMPVFDLDGCLIGFKGRALNDHIQPKYLILGDRSGKTRYAFDTYESGEVIYGLERNRGCDHVVLTEGELDCIALSQAGVSRPAAVGGSFFSDRHAQLLVQEAKEVTLFLDSNEAGRTGSWLIAKALEPHIVVRVVADHEGDPASMSSDEIRALVEEAQPTLVARADLSV